VIVPAGQAPKTGGLLLMSKNPLSAAVLTVAILVLVLAIQSPAAIMTWTSDMS
jgi:hypothetical protein